MFSLSLSPLCTSLNQFILAPEGTSATGACYLMLTAEMSNGTEVAEQSFFPSAGTVPCHSRSAHFPVRVDPCLWSVNPGHTGADPGGRDSVGPRPAARGRCPPAPPHGGAQGPAQGLGGECPPLMAGSPQALVVLPPAFLRLVSPLLPARLVCRCRIHWSWDPWGPQRGGSGCRGPSRRGCGAASCGCPVFVHKRKKRSGYSYLLKGMSCSKTPGKSYRVGVFF